MKLPVSAIAIFVFSFLIAFPAHATRFDSSYLFFDPSRPQTPSEVKYSYYQYVSRRNGITKSEAKIIAQFEIVRRLRDDQYDIRKPKIIDETDEAWIVQIPEKFSIVSRSVEGYFVARIYKENGRVEFINFSFKEK